jgi:ribonuclease HI
MHKTKIGGLILTLATASEKLLASHSKVTIICESQELTTAIRDYSETHPRKRINDPLHAALEVLINDTIINPQGSERAQPCLEYPSTDPQWTHEIRVTPTPRPIFATTPHGTNYLPTASAVRAFITAAQRAAVTESPQLTNVFDGREPNWTLSSLALRATRQGTHYTTPLPPTDTTTLLALRAGALTHQNSTCTCGQPLTLRHIHAHIEPEHLTAGYREAREIFLASELSQTTTPATYVVGDLSTCLGWVYGNDGPILAHENRKKLLMDIQKIITLFTRLMIDAAKKCRPPLPQQKRNALRHLPAPQEPPTVTPTQHPCTGYVLFTDAAVPTKNPHGIGIGVVLTYNAHPILEAWKYTPAAELPRDLTSTIGEAVAAVHGIELTTQTTQDIVEHLVHCMDNKAVIEQTSGNWHSNTTSTLGIISRLRATNARAIGTGTVLKITQLWIPRSLNNRADQLAHIAITQRSTITHLYPFTK